MRCDKGAEDGRIGRRVVSGDKACVERAEAREHTTGGGGGREERAHHWARGAGGAPEEGEQIGEQLENNRDSKEDERRRPYPSPKRKSTTGDHNLAHDSLNITF